MYVSYLTFVNALPEVGQSVSKGHIPHPCQMESGHSGAEPGRLHQKQLSGQSLLVQPGGSHTTSQAASQLFFVPVVRPPSFTQLQQLRNLTYQGSE